MTKKLLIRNARLALMLLLAAVACLMVTFFNDPNTTVALSAFAAWACLLIAIHKVPPTRGPKE